MDQLTTNVRNQKWLAMIREQKASGLTIAAWCQANNVSQHCYYYRQQKLRAFFGNEIPTFVELQPPKVATATNIDNMNSVASISSGGTTVLLTNQASEELISRIVRVLNAQ